MIPKGSETGVPRHVAIIMDGNGRWAQRRHLPRVAGHRAGAEAVRRTMQAGFLLVSLFADVTEILTDLCFGQPTENG